MKHYTMENKPKFKYGEMVKVDMAHSGFPQDEVWEGRIVGFSFSYENVIDMWIIDFEKTIAAEKFKDYQYKSIVIPHVAIINESRYNGTLVQ